MDKRKGSFSRRINGLFTSHPWIKLIALFLAIAVWVYVRGEVTRVP